MSLILELAFQVSCNENSAQLSCCELQNKLVIPAILETNVNELWEQEQDLDQPTTQDAGQDTEVESLAGVSSASSALDALTLAQHGCANIEHKAFVALFVPSHRLVAILQALQMLPNDPLVQSNSKLSNKSHEKKQKVYI